jgi:heat-inducible transcriptional repressor
MAELLYRSRRILYAAVTEYITSGEPVGSRKLARRYGLDVSPATIRNELADLEEQGYLVQPHTSAGRVPTDKGFRAFVDALVRMRDVQPEDKAALVGRMYQLTPVVE